MLKIKKLMLMFTSLFLLCININPFVVSGQEITYTATYQFVMDDNEEVPEEIIKLLPKTRSDLKTGDHITNDFIEDKLEIDNYLYEFVGWDKDEYIIEDSDITFIGTWSKTIKEEEIVQEIKENKKLMALKGVQNYFAFRWDDFGTCQGSLDGHNFYPSLYFADNKIVFCVEPSVAYPAYVEDFPYNTSTIDSYPYLSSDVKNKIVKVAQYVIEDIGTNKFESISTDMDKVGKCLAAQYLIWEFCGSEFIPYTEGSYVNQVAVGYIDTLRNAANQSSNAGINLENNSYKAFVNDVIKVGKINNPSKVTISLPDGFSFCDLNGNNVDNVNFNDGYFYIKASKSVDNGTVTIKTNNKFEEALFLDSSEGQNVVMAGSLPSETKTLTVKAEQYTIQVKKRQADIGYDYIKNCPNNYSLADAIYGIYSDKECLNEIATLKTNTNGDSNQINLEQGTYYIKEKKASRGFMLDPNVYIANLNSSNKNAVIESNEYALNDPLRFVLIKENARDKSKNRKLDKAEFTLKYYDSLSDDVSNLTPLYTWVFKPIFNENNEAEIIFDEKHLVSSNELLKDINGNSFLPLGTFTIQETKAPSTYLLDPQIYIGHIKQENNEFLIDINGGDWFVVNNKSLIQSERELIVETIATWKENNEHRYFADGYATPVDKVVYDYLIPNQSYTLKAILVDKQTGEKFLETTKEFRPTNENGYAMVEYEKINLDELANSSYVSYEYLYLTDDFNKYIKPCDKSLNSNNNENNVESLACEIEIYSENDPYLLAYHEDLNDESQSLYVDELYKAAMVLYKIGDHDKQIKLNGAYFDIKTSRTKRDGTVIRQDLGTYVTGAIYHQEDKAFTLSISKDEKMTNIIKSQASENNNGKHFVTVLGLDDGTYYIKTNLENSEIKKVEVSKGMIYLPELPEDTLVTYVETIAPKGYELDDKPFSFTVGHDYSLKVVENYRSNSMIISKKNGFSIPLTGIE